MREAYGRALAREAEKNPDIYGLIADIGSFAHNEFEKNFPDRFVNVGIAECNMIGMAAGLALEGKTPFAYTITSFITERSLEPIKVDICYPNLNAKIVGCGSGVAYSTLGATHHSIIDIGLMRSLPNMVVLSPADPREAEQVVEAAAKYNGPVYIRIGGSGQPNITQDYNFQIGKATKLREGKDCTIIGTGSVLYNALQASDILRKEKGLDVGVINMSTIKPLDRNAIIESAKETKNIITLEEHSIIGGLGSAVAEVLAENATNIPPTKFKRLGLEDYFCTEYGSHSDLEKFCKVAIPCVVNGVMNLYDEKSSVRGECGYCKKCI